MIRTMIVGTLGGCSSNSLFTLLMKTMPLRHLKLLIYKNGNGIIKPVTLRGTHNLDKYHL